MVAHLMEDCDRATENMLNHVKKGQLHPQRRTGIEHTSQKGHTKKLTTSKMHQKHIKTIQNHNKKKQADGNDIDDDAKKNTTTQTAYIRNNYRVMTGNACPKKAWTHHGAPWENMKVQTRTMIM
jgi:hypothetical protein